VRHGPANRRNHRILALGDRRHLRNDSRSDVSRELCSGTTSSAGHRAFVFATPLAILFSVAFMYAGNEYVWPVTRAKRSFTTNVLRGTRPCVPLHLSGG
jgi:hypothetical protein